MICEHMKKILTVSLAIVILLGIFSLSGAALPLVKNVVHSMPPEYQTPIKNTLNSVQSTIKNTFYSAKWEFKMSFKVTNKDN